MMMMMMVVEVEVVDLNSLLNDYVHFVISFLNLPIIIEN
jgi:hypothetical protein